MWAEKCCAAFDRPVTGLRDIEDNGNDALKLLTNRYAAVSQFIMNGNAHTILLKAFFPFPAHLISREMMTLQQRLSFRHSQLVLLTSGIGVTCLAFVTPAEHNCRRQNTRHNKQRGKRKSCG
jgi:hypothetical protein